MKTMRIFQIIHLYSTLSRLHKSSFMCGESTYVHSRSLEIVSISSKKDTNSEKHEKKDRFVVVLPVEIALCTHLCRDRSSLKGTL